MRISVQTPKPIPDLQEIIQTVLEKEVKNVQREYKTTTRTFKMSVVFKARVGQYQAQVWTNNKIYGYLDEGTRPHIIRAKNAPTLAFNTAGFVSKTKPNSINTRAGRAARPPKAFPKQVMHPGFPPRNFTKIIQKRSEKRYANNVRKAVKNALRNRK